MNADVQRLPGQRRELADEPAGGLGPDEPVDLQAQRIANERVERLARPVGHTQALLDAARDMQDGEIVLAGDQHHAVRLDRPRRVNGFPVTGRQIRQC